MNYFMQIIGNKILVSGVSAWAIAQVLKTLINFLTNKKFDPERLVGSGGMPSSHSATVCSLATATGMYCGLGGAEFAIAMVFAIVVMYDAVNVRQEAGKHAKWINLITTTLQPDIPLDIKFKEYLGHTPLQVFFGALLGIAVAVAFYNI